MRAAVLDDYQNCALSLADWSRISTDVDVTVFNRPFEGVDDAARALEPFEIVCAMRERTAIGRDLLSRLPKLKLLVTTGLRNAAIDLNAARDLGVMVCGTQVRGHATAELTWALILGLARHLPVEAANMRSGGTAIFNNNIVQNPFVWGALVVCGGLLLSAVYVPFLSSLLHTQPLQAEEWVVVIVGSLTPLVVGQFALTIAGRRRARGT